MSAFWLRLRESGRCARTRFVVVGCGFIIYYGSCSVYSGSFGYFVKLFYTAGISSAGNMKYAEKKMILATHAFVISQLFVTLPHLVLNVFGTEQIDSSLSLTVNTVNNSAAVMNSNNRIFI